MEEFVYFWLLRMSDLNPRRFVYKYQFSWHLNYFFSKTLFNEVQIFLNIYCNNTPFTRPKTSTVIINENADLKYNSPNKGDLYEIYIILKKK